MIILPCKGYLNRQCSLNSFLADAWRPPNVAGSLLLSLIGFLRSAIGFILEVDTLYNMVVSSYDPPTSTTLVADPAQRRDPQRRA